jgi:hypothetical protein
MKRAETTNKTIPCLMCENDVHMEVSPNTSSLADIEQSNFDRGVECRTYGNYGSQVWDMSGTIFFVICDGCLIKHSNKMLVKERERQTAEDHAAIMKGVNPPARYKPVRNARDYYDDWYAWLDEKYKEEENKEDSYYRSVSPYFEKSSDFHHVYKLDVPKTTASHGYYLDKFPISLNEEELIEEVRKKHGAGHYCTPRGGNFEIK